MFVIDLEQHFKYNRGCGLLHTRIEQEGYHRKQVKIHGLFNCHGINAGLMLELCHAIQAPKARIITAAFHAKSRA